MSAQFAPNTDLERVTKVLRQFEGCPAVARKMFADGLSSAISQDVVAERHEYQQRFLVATQNVLRDAHQSAVEKNAECEGFVRNAEAELHTQQVASAEAAKAEQDARAEAETKTHLTQEAKQYVAKAEREHTKVEEAKDRLCKERDQIKQEKAQHSAIADGSLRMLLEGGWEDEEIKTAVIDAVQTHLASCKADDVLIAAASSALGTKPESRHPFDVLTVDCIAEVFNVQGTKIEQRLAQGEAEEELTSAHALGMWAVADVARDAHATSECNSQSADARLETVSLTAQDEAKKTSNQESTLNALQSQHVSAGELEREIVDAIAALERLIANEYESKDVVAEAVEDSAMTDTNAAQTVAVAAAAEAMDVEQHAMEVDSVNTTVPVVPQSKVDDCTPIDMATTSVGGA